MSSPEDPNLPQHPLHETQRSRVGQYVGKIATIATVSGSIYVGFKIGDAIGFNLIPNVLEVPTAIGAAVAISGDASGSKNN